MSEFEFKEKEQDKIKKKKSNGFGMLKGTPSFKENKEEQEDLW